VAEAGKRRERVGRRYCGESEEIKSTEPESRSVKGGIEESRGEDVGRKKNVA